ncbi:MAG TPA: hypothetical protein PKE57_06180 [Cellvibrionaceae bacterium]|nr:hypothetical protein [Cellvibrionaceae bacterium]HMW47055.1 hypothetical protein [Cellvibrionaceae bacterium]HMY38021.1 hypothetical protein [Marinagarivorans sp.]HNG60043.1 hypothetical protein [Cellvibrionaceae bacterium]
MNIFSLLVKTFILLVLIGGCATAKEPDNSSFNEFWGQFRQVLLDKDFKKIQSLSANPITLRGVVDGIKPQKLPSQDIEKTLPKILEGRTSYMEAGKIIDLTNYDFVKRTSEPKLDVNSPNWQRVDNFVFIKDKTGWKLKEIFWEEME